MRGNHLERAARYLDRRMRDVASVWVTYWRGSQSARVRATIGVSAHQADDATGGLLTWQAVDFIISQAELPWEPLRGDNIDWTPPGDKTERRYEVINPLSDDAYSNSDEYRYSYRIHTQRIAIKS